MTAISWVFKRPVEAAGTGLPHNLWNLPKKTGNQVLKPQKKPKREEPTSGTQPSICMIQHQAQNRHPVTMLLETGCSVPLIHKKTAKWLKLRLFKHEEQRHIRNFTGETVKGAGEFYTNPLMLQHRRHFTQEVMEVAPMDKEINIFLPFWWITKHPPQGAWTTDEVRFNSASCLKRRKKYESNEFSLTWDPLVATDSSAQFIGYVSAVEDRGDPLEQVLQEFYQYLHILSKEAADEDPEHCSYDCKIGFKEGSMAPWGTIYPLPENELQTLKEWLKEMERTGKIKRSTSPTGSSILFVPNPN